MTFNVLPRLKSIEDWFECHAKRCHTTLKMDQKMRLKFILYVTRKPRVAPPRRPPADPARRHIRRNHTTAGYKRSPYTTMPFVQGHHCEGTNTFQGENGAISICEKLVI